MLSKIDKENIKKANCTYLDKYKNLKMVQKPEDVPESAGRGNYRFVDISEYNVNELYGSPIMNEDEESLTVKRKDGELICLEGNHYLKKYPVLVKIYELAEAVLDDNNVMDAEDIR